MSWPVGLYLAAILMPLLAFGLILAAGRRWSGRTCGWVAVGAIGTSLALSLVGLELFLLPLLGHSRPPVTRATWDWVALGEALAPGRPLAIPLGVDVDNVAAMLFATITAIALAVMVYSVEAMADDPLQGTFFAQLSLFCSAMLGLVAASGLIGLFIGWELVGFCSWLLIGFWSGKDANARAAQKAFVVNRIGDVGMLVGIGILWVHLGSVDFRDLNGSVPQPNLTAFGRAYGHEPPVDRIPTVVVDGRDVVRFSPAATDRSGPMRTIPYSLLVVAGLGLVAGAVAKSAQFPLQVWLPEAMAGPTPASALIHAATMVAAGVYLVARVFPILTPEVLLVVAYTGAITLLLAATAAMVQEDYKKVLAYSTVSQLGFMMLGLGVGGWSAGLFHLFTHAWFKATLFLGAGSVYAAVHTYRMADLGGLYTPMRTTALVMLAATMAIAGVPLFSGFASKDAILASALHFVQGHPRHLLLFLAPAVGATLTAFYMFRLWFLLFAGSPRSEAADRAVEAGPLVRRVLVALAVPTVAAGWSIVLLPLGFEPLAETWFRAGEPFGSIDPGGSRWWAMGASVLVGAVGFGLGALYYGPWNSWRRLDAGRVARRFGPVHRLLASGWHLDALYRIAVVRPLEALARWLGVADRRGVDALVNLAARAVERLGRFEGAFDRLAVDGLVALVARGAYAAGDRGRMLQTGHVRGYLMMLGATVVTLGAAAFAWVLMA